MVYPSEDGHPSTYQPGLALINFVDQTNDANHYTMPPTESPQALAALVLTTKTKQENKTCTKNLNSTN